MRGCCVAGGLGRDGARGFGTAALRVSPRVGPIHVIVDDAPWHWADTSGEPLIIVGLPPGPHRVEIILADAVHQALDRATVEFTVPMADAGRGPE